MKDQWGTPAYIAP